MNTRQTLLFGLAGLGFVLGMPAQAASPTQVDLAASAKLLASEFREPEPSFMLAKREESDRYETRPEQRDEARPKGNKKSQAREADRPSEPQDYGYGYERRQQPNPRHDDDRGRH